MKLPLAIAKKLQALKTNPGLPVSQLNSRFTDSLVADGILEKQVFGRTKGRLRLMSAGLLDSYLKNKYGINSLEKYIEGLENKDLDGKESIDIANNTKIKRIRYFKGFLVNSFLPFPYSLNGINYTFKPQPGSFLYVHDFESFSIPVHSTIVGVENPENFRFVELQQNLFSDISPVFVSRYPQSGDLVNWLKQINNPYIHFGDFDFAGISIYLFEYKIHLSERATFYIPENILDLIIAKGNRGLYNRQLHIKETILAASDQQTASLISLISEAKKGLEQQVLITD